MKTECLCTPHGHAHAQTQTHTNTNTTAYTHKHKIFFRDTHNSERQQNKNKKFTTQNTPFSRNGESYIIIMVKYALLCNQNILQPFHLPSRSSHYFDYFPILRETINNDIGIHLLYYSNTHFPTPCLRAKPY